MKSEAAKAAVCLSLTAVGLFAWWLFWTSVEIAIDRIIGVFA